MATYIGSIYKTRKTDGTYDSHYWLTHANAVLTTSEKTFITQDQLDFVDSLLGEGSTGGVSFTDLVDRVEAVEGSLGTVSGDVATQLGELGTRLISIEEFFSMGEDQDNIISSLNEIYDFVKNAAITEGTTFEDFIQSFSPNLSAYGGNIAPEVTSTHNLGSSTHKWKDLYLSGKVNSATLGTTSNATIGGTLGVTGVTTLAALTTTGLISANNGLTLGDGKDIKASSWNHYKVGTGGLGDMVHNVKEIYVGNVAPTNTNYNRVALSEGLVWVDTSGNIEGGGQIIANGINIKFKMLYNDTLTKNALLEAFKSSIYRKTTLHSAGGKRILLIVDTPNGFYNLNYYQTNSSDGNTDFFALFFAKNTDDINLSNDGILFGGTPTKVFFEGSVAANDNPASVTIKTFSETEFTLQNAHIVINNLSALIPIFTINLA